MKLRWRRALFGFGIIVGVAYLYLFVFGAPFALTKRDFKNPAMWKVPAAIPAHAISNGSGKTLSYFGWEFEVPWTDFDPSKAKSIGKPPWQWQVIGFRSGRQIVFIRHPTNYWSKVLFPTHASYTERAYYRWLFGADASSDYAFTRAMLEVTPDQLASFTFRGRRARLIAAPDFQIYRYADPRCSVRHLHDRHFRFQRIPIWKPGKRTAPD